MPRRTSTKAPTSRKKTSTGGRNVAHLRKALLTRDEWLRLAAQGSQLGLWYWNEVTHTLFCDRKTREIFGVNLEGDVTPETFYAVLHPDDRAHVERVWRHELTSGLPYELLYRTLRPDGTVRWINARGSGYYDKSARPLYMIGVVFDVTERKEAERERMELGGKLISAQERERRHLAREIHDDFCQRFAGVTFQLSALAHSIENEDAKRSLAESLDVLATLGKDIQQFSHRLHSSRLDVLGLVRSIESLCTDMMKEHDIRIEFAHANMPPNLSPDVSLGVFRIVQEGLQNILKHSGAAHAKVTLKTNAGAIELTVFDDGKGFDPDASHPSEGIGIESMKERARMFDGQLQIRSRPLVPGTRIDVSIPILRDVSPA